MADTKDQYTPAEAVAMTTLANLVVDHPEAVNSLLIKHGEQPDKDPEVNFLKLVALTSERGPFFTDDLQTMAANQAGYFSLKGIFQGIKTVGDKLVKVGATAVGVPALGNIAGSGVLQGLFKKKQQDSTPPQTESQATSELNQNQTAQKIAEQVNALPKTMSTESDQPKKPEPTKILGMTLPIFIPVVLVVLAIIIFLIVRFSGKSKKKKLEEKK